MGIVMSRRLRDAKNDGEKLPVLWDMLDALVDPDVDRSELESAVMACEIDEVDTAIGEAVRSYAPDPTSAGGTPSPGSSGGSPTGERTSRVVSLSQAAG
jgi:hypothetical protein